MPKPKKPALTADEKSILLVQKKLAELPPSGNLTVAYTGISILPPLPDTVKILYCDGNQLKQLPELPPNLTWLGCGQNRLTELPNLPPTLKFLRCSGNLLTSLPELPEGFQDLDCYGNASLQSLPTLPSTLKNLRCGNTAITVIPNFPPSLTHVFLGGAKGITSLPPLPPGLVNLHIASTGIQELPEFPESIKDTIQEINCIYAPLIEPFATLFSNLWPNIHDRAQLRIFIDGVNEYHRNKKAIQNLESFKTASNSLSHTPFDPKYKGLEPSIVMNYLSGVPRGSINERILQLREKLSRPPGGPGVGGRRKSRRNRRRKQSRKSSKRHR